ncbi:preprotein translocase subunit YajC [Conyzicola lurida]|uniref:Preprotein translocase subunit YajC n=1 Tax=Conyzicola lurida TaxID=1172621 RepID=A0A841ANA4_9MICO|nr:preprotein translocase subunit YajC [Conyzicola lurida]MBB5843231.1 preprotein translocase subunit YajC [Conyzicola lurida]
MNDTILNIALVIVLALFVFYAFRNSRKNKAKQAELKSQIVPGVEVMTNFGLFGTLLSIDEASNVAEIETSPGNVVRVHRQTLAKVVTEADAVAGGEPRSVEEAMEIANREAEAREKAANPEFGELAEPVVADKDEVVVVDEPVSTDKNVADTTGTDETPVKKPVRRTTKKVDE